MGEGAALVCGDSQAGSEVLPGLSCPVGLLQQLGKAVLCSTDPEAGVGLVSQENSRKTGQAEGAAHAKAQGQERAGEAWAAVVDAWCPVNWGDQQHQARWP